MYLGALLIVSTYLEVALLSALGRANRQTSTLLILVDGGYENRKLFA